MNSNAKHERSRWRWWTLGIISVAVLIVTIDTSILNVAIPTLQREFDASASQLQWIVTAYILIFAGLLLTMGGLGDRFGRAHMLRGGVLVFGIASLIATMVGSAGQLIACRAVMGIGGAMLLPATLSILVNIFDEEERPKAIALWAGFNGIGIAIGPIAGGLLLEHFYWGSIFFVNVPIAAFVILASFLLVPNSRDPEVKPVDIPGAILSTGGVSALVYAIIEGPDRGWTSALVVSTFAVAFVMSLAFAFRERRTENPLLDFYFFRKRRFSAGVATVSLGALAMSGLVFGITQYLQFVQSYTPLEAGIRLLPLAGGIMLGASRSEILVRYVGTKKVVSGGMFLLSIALGLVMLWEADSAFWFLGLTLGLIGLGLGITAAPATDAIMGAIPKERAGVGSATNTVIRLVAASLGVAIIGSMMYSIYSSRVSDAVVALSPDLADAARNSIGAAVQIAASLPEDAGTALASASGDAFTEALGIVGLIGAVIALFATGMVARFLPDREESLTEEEAIPDTEHPGEPASAVAGTS